MPRRSRLAAALPVLVLAGLTTQALADAVGSTPEPDGQSRSGSTPAEIVLQVCERVSAKLASVSLADCAGRDLALSAGRSAAGTPLLMKEYAPLGARVPRARVLLIGGTHGDELSSVSIVFKWMKILDRHHSGLFHWHFVPVLNPDGLLSADSTRTNGNGVDLNRNLPTPAWQRESESYWLRTGRNPRRYPGPAAASEPETRWLISEIREFAPDVIFSVHAPHGIVDFDGPPHPPKRLGSLHLNLLGIYPGSLGNYAGVQLGIPVVTIELASAGSMPTDGETRTIWTDLVRWLLGRFPEGPAPRLATSR